MELNSDFWEHRKMRLGKAVQSHPRTCAGNRTRDPLHLWATKFATISIVMIIKTKIAFANKLNALTQMTVPYP